MITCSIQMKSVFSKFKRGKYFPLLKPYAFFVLLLLLENIIIIRKHYLFTYFLKSCQTVENCEK